MKSEKKEITQIPKEGITYIAGDGKRFHRVLPKDKSGQDEC